VIPLVIRAAVAAFVALLWLGAPPAGAEVSGTLRSALDLYAQAQVQYAPKARQAAFARAALAFSKLAEANGMNADLFANAGTAAMQAERPGLAVLSFRRALHVDQSHSRAQTNLNVMRAAMPGWLKPQHTNEGFASQFKGLSRLSQGDQTALTAIAFLLASSAVALAMSGYGGGAIRVLAVVLLLSWAGLLGSLLTNNTNQADAVLMTESLIRAADSVNAPGRFQEPAPQGTEVRVLERRAEWVRVQLPTGRDGWIRPGALKMVVSPRSA
jgi:hypothetical protein